MWRFIKDSNGIHRSKYQNIPTLHVGESKIIEDKEKVNEFASFYESVGKDKYKNKSNNNQDIIHFKKLLQEDTAKSFNLAINEPFQITELENVLKNKKPSAPGDDGIGYEVYKNLPDSKKKIYTSRT